MYYILSSQCEHRSDPQTIEENSLNHEVTTSIEYARSVASHFPVLIRIETNSYHWHSPVIHAFSSWEDVLQYTQQDIPCWLGDWHRDVLAENLL